MTLLERVKRWIFPPIASTPRTPPIFVHVAIRNARNRWSGPHEHRYTLLLADLEDADLVDGVEDFVAQVRRCAGQPNLERLRSVDVGAIRRARGRGVTSDVTCSTSALVELEVDVDAGVAEGFYAGKMIWATSLGVGT